MRKVFCLILLFLAGCSFQSKEERFVNPLFYETLYASSSVEDIEITPNSITYINDQSASNVLPCKVIKDVGYQIIMKCENIFDSMSETIYYRFTNTGIEKYNKDVCKIFTEIFADSELTKLEMSLWYWPPLNKENGCGLSASLKDIPSGAHYN